MLEFLRVEIISYSPATDTIGDSVFYVEADGGSYISDYLNTYSYGAGRLTLRTSTTTTMTIVHVLWIRMVTSVTFGMSSIPTGVKYIRTYIEITLIGYIYLQLIVVYNGQADYWWLRSPATYYAYGYAHPVDSDGYVGGINWPITDSYGRRSPVTNITGRLFFTVSDGGVFHNSGYGSDVNTSYGIK